MFKNSMLAAVAAVLLPLTATAVPATYQFSGQIGTATSSYGYPNSGFTQWLAPLGSHYTGSFTYETETPGYVSPTFISYTGAITGATITFGDAGEFGTFSFLDQPTRPGGSFSSLISLGNDQFFNGGLLDEFNLNARLEGRSGDAPNVYRFLSFYAGDFSAQMLPPGETLADPLPLDAFFANFQQFSFGYSRYDDAGNWLETSSVGGPADTFAPVQVSVPEPDELALLTLVLAGVILATRRRPTAALRAA